MLEDRPSSGLFVGLVFELLYYLGGASLGGARPEHETLPAVTATAASAALANASESASSDGTPAIWALGILVCVPLGPLGKRLESAFDARAARYLGAALTASDAGNFSRVARQNLWGMWPHFVGFGALGVLAGQGSGYLRCAPGFMHAAAATQGRCAGSPGRTPRWRPLQRAWRFAAATASAFALGALRRWGRGNGGARGGAVGWQVDVMRVPASLTRCERQPCDSPLWTEPQTP